MNFAKCPDCGCRWRDNGDDTMSLADGAQRSCAMCEHAPWGYLLRCDDEPIRCTCALQTLMVAGCTCGAMAREREAQA